MARKPQRQSAQSTVDPAEVERFSALAAEWWDPRGKMAPLHKFNPVRSAISATRPPPASAATPSGSIPEGPAHPRHRLRRRPPVRAAGAARRVDGRASTRPRPTSRRRSSTPAQADLPIDYRCTTAEELAEAGERFDIVLAMEVVEHVADVPLFVAELRRDGEARRADDRRHLNRTLKSFALAIVGAEYILRWLPVGSHRWDKFVTPNELEIAMEQGGLRVIGEQGVIYNILADRWQLSTRHGRELHACRRRSAAEP